MPAASFIPAGTTGRMMLPPYIRIDDL